MLKYKTKHIAVADFEVATKDGVPFVYAWGLMYESEMGLLSKWNSKET